MKAALAKSPSRPGLKAKKKAARRAAAPKKPWTPPDYKRWLAEDFGGKIQPFSYVDFLER